MPVRKVFKDGKVGYQWGNQKIYPTKEQAEAQGRAIRIAQKKREEQ